MIIEPKIPKSQNPTLILSQSVENERNKVHNGEKSLTKVYSRAYRYE